MVEVANDPSEEGGAFLPWWGWTLLVLSLIGLVPAVGLVVEDVGWNRLGARLLVWGVLAVVSAVVTWRFVDSYLPVICGVLIGAQVPRPSDSWFRQLAGEEWGRMLSLVVFGVVVAIGIVIYQGIARGRWRASEP